MCALLRVCEEVMLELYICLIGYVKKCKYKISDGMLAQAHDRERVAVGCVERSGTRGAGVG